MPRKARVLVLGYPHHVVQRGHNRQVVFVTDDDYHYYLSNLLEWKTTLNIRVNKCVPFNHPGWTAYALLVIEALYLLNE